MGSETSGYPISPFIRHFEQLKLMALSLMIIWCMWWTK